MDHELIPINITIADRTYRLKVQADEEEFVRKTVKEVNKKILEFKVSFAGKDMQDYISMCLIWYATQSRSNETTPSPLSSNMEEFFKKLESNLDEMLQ